MTINGRSHRPAKTAFRWRMTLAGLILVCCLPCIVLSQFESRLPSSFNACDFCLASQGISPLEVGSSGFRMDVRYLSVGTMFQDGSKTANMEHEVETHLTQQYTFFVAPISSLSFAVLVPVPRRHSEQTSEQGVAVIGNQFGVGDISLLARYKPFLVHNVEKTYILSLSVGVKLPTGKTNGHDNQGDLLDAHIQLGTGSTDALLGVSGFATTERFAFIVNLLGAFTGAGANGHQFGNSLNYDITARYRAWPVDYDSPQFFLTLSLNGDLRGHEIQDGVTDANSGGNVLYISPGMQIFISSSLTFDFTFQQPIAHQLYGQQLGEDYRLMSGLQILF